MPALGDKHSNYVGMGIIYGLSMAVLFIIFVVVLYIARGSEPFNRLDVNLSSVIALYLIGGILGGAIGGYLFFFNWSDTWWGRGVVGMLALLPVSVGASFMISGWASVFGAITQAVLYATIVGGIAGIIVLGPGKPEQKSRPGADFS